MTRRRSLCFQSQTPSSEEDSFSIARSASFTIDASHRTPGNNEGVRILQGYPLKIREPSPRRTSRFQFPGSRILRAGLSGFRRHKKPAVLKSPCVWMDNPKCSIHDEDTARKLTIKGDLHPSEKSICECATNEAFDLFPEEGVLNFPLEDALNRRTVVTLSRLQEAANISDRSLLGTPLSNTSRTDQASRKHSRICSSVSSLHQSTSRTDYPSSRIESSSSLDTHNASHCSGGSGDGRHLYEQRSQEPIHAPNPYSTYNQDFVLNEKVAELDSDMLLRLQRRSFSSMDYSNLYPDSSFSPSGENHEINTPIERPRTRFDSRLHGSSHYKTKNGGWVPPSAITASSRSAYSQGTDQAHFTDRSSDFQPESFRSDHILFHPQSHGCRRLEMGSTLHSPSVTQQEHLAKSSRSEGNLCIGKRPDTMASKVSMEKKRERELRRMKLDESLMETDPLSFMMAKALALHNSVEEDECSQTMSHTPASDQEHHSSSVAEGSVYRDHIDYDEGSIIQDPKNLAMWFDWLEERSNLTRKEILYRLKCQKAFIQESAELLAQKALLAEEFEDVLYPTMKDRLSELKKKFLPGNNEMKELKIDDDEIADMPLDQHYDDDVVDEPNDTRLGLHLNI